MSPEKELDLKFLERSLQRQENLRQIFSRDLKIVTLLVLAFQFVIFFRFVNLYEQRANLSLRLTQLGTEQKALTDIQGKLVSLRETLVKGGEELSEHLKKAPSLLRDQILIFEQYLTDVRGERPPGRLPGPSLSSPIQMPVQTQLPEEASPGEVFFMGLSNGERNILKTADPRDKIFTELIKHIVEQKMIQPLFLGLNSDKRELLDKAFAEKRGPLIKTIRAQRDTLEVYGVAADGMERQINLVERKLQSLSFRPPTSDSWWRTFGGKVGVAMQEMIDTNVMVTQIGQELQAYQQDLTKSTLQLSALIQESEAKKAELDNRMKKVQDNYAEVQSFLDKYTKPFSLFALEPKDAVLYYPVILIFLFVYFGWRYVLLRRRVQALAVIYRNYGLSDQALKIYLADLSWVVGIPSQNERRRRFFVARGVLPLLFAVPGVLAALSIRRIWISPSLKGDAPMDLYALAGALFILCCILATVWFFKSSPRSVRYTSS